MAKHWSAFNRLAGWRKGEAVRQALFRWASLGSRANPDSKLGWGAVRAAAMLAIRPADLGSHTE
ncbi:hypothetical protein [Bosea sp. Tri-49]|uniref:hypothetical protein n=1 Tax=Bosea sp. Tri-49 TaxID=1867715 RepID=UPI003FA44370